ncbi:hypothetical protein [Allochromatium palmeri]|uniref:Uncharacterized protein n=1 Tax=Allochromatium palmeri TaxID=231048 RepID=A0A6N8EB71_9GAMM|nr:hypothetical protein [Allochromatium palmeri]MTW21502.1 hypothetical protein [Allochromatium palmeri]
MQSTRVDKRTIEAVGSVMDLWPMGDYSEYVPRGTARERIYRHWVTVGRHLKTAVAQYERAAPASRAFRADGR